MYSCAPLIRTSQHEASQSYSDPVERSDAVGGHGTVGEDPLWVKKAAFLNRNFFTGASISSSRDAQTLVDALPQVLRATAGCHPHHAIDLDAAASLADDVGRFADADGLPAHAAAARAWAGAANVAQASAPTSAWNCGTKPRPN